MSLSTNLSHILLVLLVLYKCLFVFAVLVVMMLPFSVGQASQLCCSYAVCVVQSSVTLPPPQQQPLTFYVAHPFIHVMWLFPSNQSAVLKHNTVNFGMLYSGGYAAPHASRSMTINFYNNTKHENQTTQWLPLPNVSI